MCRSVLCDEEGDTMTPDNGDIAVINGAVAAGIGKPQNYKSGNGLAVTIKAGTLIRQNWATARNINKVRKVPSR